MNNPLLAEVLTTIVIVTVGIGVPLALSRRMRAVLWDILGFRSHST